jgi:predicted NAD/FAD-binding protein/DUF1365 family protein
MRIAVIGTGIAGNVIAHRLHAAGHDLAVFEADSRIGGHTHTHALTLEGDDEQQVDTGFIVFNDRTYPNFIALLDELGVASQESSMSFSVCDAARGLEYNGTSLDGVFAQRRNLLRPTFLGMLADILRFHRIAPALLAEGGQGGDGDQDTREITLADYLAQHRFRGLFVSHYLVPMGAAIWSTDPARMMGFPARFFIRFLHNHGMLTVDDRPVWRTIRGGSARYLERLVAPWRDRVRLASPVEVLRRAPDGVRIGVRGHALERFDHVFVACHADQALRLLADPSDEEREILGALPYQRNEALLHTDTSLLPRTRRARAAWNYHLLPRPPASAAEGATAGVALTYDMNVLQRLSSRHTFCVTLNGSEHVDPNRVLKRLSYEHPLFTPAGVAATAAPTGATASMKTASSARWLRCAASSRFTMHSALYNGWLEHRRHRPRKHVFRYRLFMAYLDLAELDTVFRGRWLWSTSRRALARFDRRDHFGDSALPLDEAVRRLVAERTGVRPGGPIRLLTHLRYFGHVFNPVSFYYCFDVAGTNVQTVVAEVNNTPWGERHCYVLPRAPGSAGGELRASSEKAMHVSPFHPMALTYQWRVGTPQDTLAVAMALLPRAAEGAPPAHAVPVFDALLSLQRVPIATAALATALLRFPFMTAQVVLAIHWQALRLWLKRVPVHDHPAPHGALSPARQEPPR